MPLSYSNGAKQEIFRKPTQEGDVASKKDDMSQREKERVLGDISKIT